MIAFRRFASSKAKAAAPSLIDTVQQFDTASALESFIVSTPSENFTEELTANCFAKLVALRSQAKEPLHKLESMSEKLVFQPRELAQCLQAYSTKKLAAEQLPTCFLDQIEHSLPYLKANAICDSLVALSNLQQKQVPLHFFDAIAQELMDRDLLPYFQRIALVGTINSLAKLNYVPAEVLIQRFAQEVNTRDVRKFTPREIVTLFQSLSKWDANLEPFMERILRLDLSSSAWKSQDLAQLMKSIANCSDKHKNQQLDTQIERALASKDLKAFFPESLVCVLEAFSSARNVSLVQRVAEELEHRDFKYFTLPQLVRTAASLAKLRYSNSQLLLSKVAEQVDLRSAEFTPTELVELVRAFSLFQDKSIVVDSVMESLVERLHELDFDELVDLCFSLAVLDVLKPTNSPHAVQRLFFQLSEVEQKSTAPHVVAEMLQLTKLAWSFAQPKRSSPLLKSLDRGRWSDLNVDDDADVNAKRATTTEYSSAHFAAYEMLDAMMNEDILEYKPQGEEVKVDVLIRASKTVIEFEPPSSVLSCGKRRTGEVLLRRKLLRLQGYMVFGFPMKGFGNMAKAQQEQRVKDFIAEIKQARKR